MTKNGRAWRSNLDLVTLSLSVGLGIASVFAFREHLRLVEAITFFGSGAGTGASIAAFVNRQHAKTRP